MKKNSYEPVIVITPESRLFPNRAKSRFDIPGIERIAMTDVQLLSSSVSGRLTSLSSLADKSIFERDREFSVSINYRTKLPSAVDNNHVNTPTSRAMLKNSKPSSTGKTIASKQITIPSSITMPALPRIPNVTYKRNNEITESPSVLIAKLLTTQGHGSHYPQLFPTFKDATLTTIGKTEGFGPDRSRTPSYSFLKNRLLLQNKISATYIGGNKIFINEINETSSSGKILNTIPRPNMDDSHTGNFPIRSKRKTWKRIRKV